LKHGDRVIATARKPEQLSDLEAEFGAQVKAVRLDVTKTEEVQAAIATAVATFGRIDVVVNNAGYGALGAIEELSDAVVRQQYETNVFGVLNVTRAVLPTLRQQRSGHILNLSSVGGIVSFPASGIYCSTKFALEGISEALAREVEPLGIKVTIVEPGAFRTDFGGRSLVKPEQFLADYAATTSGMLQWLEQLDGKQPGDPDKAAQAMIQVVESPQPPLRLALGADAVGAIEQKLKSMQAELDTWRQVALDTAFPGVEVGAIGG
jgi:NAD(P)-dependent dehydrogenase (short-subunit alcohol dehydrogenase family)